MRDFGYEPKMQRGLVNSLLPMNRTPRTVSCSNWQLQLLAKTRTSSRILRLLTTHIGTGRSVVSYRPIVTFFDGGVNTGSMEVNFEKVNRLLKDYGYRQTAIVLAAPISMKDLETYLGVKASTGFKGDAARGSIMLGKVGACFSNLKGLFDGSTM
jgi:hypothetical protein